jgi:hypothetical protein
LTSLALYAKILVREEDFLKRLIVDIPIPEPDPATIPPANATAEELRDWLATQPRDDLPRNLADIYICD